MAFDPRGTKTTAGRHCHFLLISGHFRLFRARRVSDAAHIETRDHCLIVVQNLAEVARRAGNAHSRRSLLSSRCPRARQSLATESIAVPHLADSAEVGTFGQPDVLVAAASRQA